MFHNQNVTQYSWNHNKFYNQENKIKHTETYQQNMQQCIWTIFE